MVDLSSPWPDWGSTGTQPSDGKSYGKGDNPESVDFNYLWHQIRQTLLNVEDEIEQSRTYADNAVSSHESQTQNVHGVGNNDVASTADVQAVEDKLTDGGTTYDIQKNGTDGDGAINFQT